MIEIAGINYECIRGSDVDRDGMYLELSTSDRHVVLEIFYSDKTGTMTVTAFDQDIPIEALEWLIARAKISLPPTKSENQQQVPVNR